MGREQQKSQDIAGYQYVVTPLGGRTGRKVADELMRAVLPALIELVTALPEDRKKLTVENVLSSISLSQAQAALEMAFKALPSARVDALIEQMSASTDIYGPGFGEAGLPAGAPLNLHFDDHFAGRYKAMYQWLVFALKVNFADFFSERVGEIVGDPQPSAARR